jgi:hypothetical protein
VELPQELTREDKLCILSNYGAMHHLLRIVSALRRKQIGVAFLKSVWCRHVMGRI